MLQSGLQFLQSPSKPLGIIITISLLKTFGTSICWWSFLKVWVTVKSPKVSPLSILANLNKAINRMVSIHPLISNSTSLFTKSLGTVPSSLTTNDITVTLVFHSFFNSLIRSKYLSNFWLFLFGVLEQQNSEELFLYSC